MRRGLQLDALKEFILSQGASRNVTLQEWDKIWTINKRIIDPVCPRHTAVKQAARVKLHLSNGPATPEVVAVPKHKKYAPAGVKATTHTQDIWLDQEDAVLLAEGEEVTLMDWGNAVVESISKDGEGLVSHMHGRLHLEGSVKSTKWKLTWLPDIPDLVPLQLVDFGHLITKKRIEEDDVFENFVNPESRFESLAWGDANMRTLQRGTVLQLERRGYFIVDSPLFKVGKPLALFAVPDGRTKSVSAVAAPVKGAQPNGKAGVQ